MGSVQVELWFPNAHIYSYVSDLEFNVFKMEYFSYPKFNSNNQAIYQVINSLRNGPYKNATLSYLYFQLSWKN
jgi:hypothetical protein